MGVSWDTFWGFSKLTFQPLHLKLSNKKYHNIHKFFFFDAKYHILTLIGFRDIWPRTSSLSNINDGVSWDTSEQTPLLKNKEIIKYESDAIHATRNYRKISQMYYKAELAQFHALMPCVLLCLCFCVPLIPMCPTCPFTRMHGRPYVSSVPLSPCALLPLMSACIMSFRVLVPCVPRWV